MPNQPPPRRPTTTLALGQVRGVPIVVAPSWLLIIGLLSAVYGPIVRDWVPHISASTSYLTAIGFALIFGVCVLAHEVGHTLVSLALGHPVRRVLLFALGGVSEMDTEPERARDELLIAAAGPLVSIVIALGAWFGFQAVDGSSVPGVVLALLAWSNAVLAGFNLLPGLPLDGGRLLRAAVRGCGASPVTGTRVAGWAGRVVAVLIALGGLVADRTSVGVSAGVFSLALAAYLWVGATHSLKLASLLDQLPAVTVDDLLRPGLLVPADVSVAEALRRAWDGRARGLVLLDSAARPSAIVDESRIGAVPPDRRAWTSVAEVARPLEPGLMIPLGVDAQGLLDRMRATPAREYLVVAADGTPAGIIATIDFARQLRGAT